MYTTSVIIVTLLCVSSAQAHIGYHPPRNNNDRHHSSGHGHALHETGPNKPGECAVCHGILCNEFNFTVWWHKAEFVGDEYGVKLLDATCYNFYQNQTMVWITSAFGTCGSAIIENKKFITQRNTATLTVRNVTSNIAREHVYKYNLECLFARENNASTGYKLVQGIKKTVDLNAESAFDISIDIYTSNSYLIKSGLPVTISMNQPIYVGINKIHNNKHFKMIVEDCFATPTASVSGESYVFFQNKCAADPSFKIISTGNRDLFSFVITAFRFVKISKSIYMHCRAIMCQSKSTSSQCVQSCSQRSSSFLGSQSRRYRRRAHLDYSFPSDIFANADIEEIQNITSQKIVVVEKRTCGDLLCVPQSTCVDLYPAVCRCHPGYVYSSIDKRCLNERILKINNLHLKSTWVRTYGDETSEDFTRFASDSESFLLDAFKELRISHVEGVKVISAKQKKGVLVDFSILYRRRSTPEDIVETFIKPFVNQEPLFMSTLEKMKVVNTDTIPYIFQGTYAPGPTVKSRERPTVRKLVDVTIKKKEEHSYSSVEHKKDVDNHDNHLDDEKESLDIIDSSNAGNGTSTAVTYFKQRTLIWILLGVSFIAILLVIGVVCHYKRTIYYHLMTW